MKLVQVHPDYQLIDSVLKTHKILLTKKNISLNNKINTLTISLINELKGDVHDPVDIATLVENKYSITCSLFNMRISQIKDYNEKILELDNYNKEDLFLRAKVNYANKIINKYKEKKFNINIPFLSNKTDDYFEKYSYSLTKKVAESESCDWLQSVFKKKEEDLTKESIKIKEIFGFDRQIYHIMKDILFKVKKITPEIDQLIVSKNEVSDKITLLSDLIHTMDNKNNSNRLFLPEHLAKSIFDPLDNIIELDVDSLIKKSELIEKAHFGLNLTNRESLFEKDGEFVTKQFIKDVYCLLKFSEQLFNNNELKSYHLDLIKETLMTFNVWELINFDNFYLDNKSFITQIKTIIKLGNF